MPADPTLPQFRLGAWRLSMQMNAWELKSMSGSSHRRLGAQFDAWELKSTPGRSNRRLRAQIDAWEVKSTFGNSNRRLGAQINTWEVKSTPQNLHTGGEQTVFSSEFMRYKKNTKNREGWTTKIIHIYVIVE